MILAVFTRSGPAAAVLKDGKNIPQGTSCTAGCIRAASSPTVGEGKVHGIAFGVGTILGWGREGMELCCKEGHSQRQLWEKDLAG